MLRIPILLGLAGVVSFLLYRNEQGRKPSGAVAPAPLSTITEERVSQLSSSYDDPLQASAPREDDEFSDSSVELEDLRL